VRRAAPVHLALVAVLAWAAAPACGAEPGEAGPPETGGGPRSGRPAEGGPDRRRAEVRFPGGRLFVAEIADTPARIQRGYMFRREVGDDEGMIFVFPESGFHSFWMKNTLVPLDMIWMDDTFTVIHVEHAVPPCEADPCSGYGPPRKSRYVLEVRAGAARGAGLKTGDRLRVAFPQSAP
jgi:hypothetical protein